MTDNYVYQELVIPISDGLNIRCYVYCISYILLSLH